MTSANGPNDQGGQNKGGQAGVDMLLHPFPRPANSKPLKPIMRYVESARNISPRDALEAIEQVRGELADNLRAYWGPPDVWHNLSIDASRLGADEAEYILWQGGLLAWPDNVDLLCDMLAEYVGPGNQHYSPANAKTAWRILEQLPRDQTAPYWRFWAFGAQYYAQIERNPQAGINFLDEGLLQVKRDGLVDILRNYRSMLVDQIPRKKIGTKELEEYQTLSLKTLEDRYRLGIQLGVENAYTLATELATLFQERAASRAAAPAPATSSSTASLDAETVQRLVRDDLERALTYLDIAAALYTGDRRHGIEKIYQPRIRILMAQGQYGDALNLAKSLPEELQNEPSMAAMRRFATLATGGKLEPAVDRDTILNDLFDGVGTDLERLARTNEVVMKTLVEVFRRLSGSGGSE